MAAVGLSVNADASSEAGAACGIAAQLLDELFPAVLAALRHDDDAAAMSVVPFLQVSTEQVLARQCEGQEGRRTLSHKASFALHGHELPAKQILMLTTPMYHGLDDPYCGHTQACVRALT